MSNFEESHIYELLGDKCRFYKRFIDDIFLLWNGTQTELETILEKLNTIHPTIKFDAKFSKTSTEFLDTKFYNAANALFSSLDSNCHQSNKGKQFSHIVLLMGKYAKMQVLS